MPTEMSVFLCQHCKQQFEEREKALAHEGPCAKALAAGARVRQLLVEIATVRASCPHPRTIYAEHGAGFDKMTIRRCPDCGWEETQHDMSR